MSERQFQGVGPVGLGAQLLFGIEIRVEHPDYGPGLAAGPGIAVVALGDSQPQIERPLPFPGRGNREPEKNLPHSLTMLKQNGKIRDSDISYIVRA